MTVDELIMRLQCISASGHGNSKVTREDAEYGPEDVEFIKVSDDEVKLW